MNQVEGQRRVGCCDGVRRHPLFASALWLVFAHVLGQWHWSLLPALLALAAFAGLRCGGRRLAVAWCGLILLAVAIGQVRDWRAHRLAGELLESPTATFGGVVEAKPRGAEGFWQAPVRLTHGPAGHGARVWWQGRGELPVEGSRVEALGRFHRPQPPRNPGEFDRPRWLRQHGLLVSFRQQPHVLGEVHTPGWARTLAAARAAVRDAMTCGLDPDSVGAEVIRAVVLGEKPGDNEDLLEDFRRSGSMHVFSVSGMHVGMVGVLAWGVLGLSGLPRRWLALPVIVLVFGYAWLTGAQPPAVRAAWMAAVFLGAFCLRRRPDLANALGAVLLVLLLWDLSHLRQPGVQLSYGVVAAIAFGLPWTTRWFRRLGAPPLHLPLSEIHGLRRVGWRLRQGIASTLAVSTAAALGAAPLTAWHFGLVTPVSVVAALLLLPAVFGVMALALASVVLSPLGAPVVTPINKVNAHVAHLCADAAGYFARVPGGHWKLRQQRDPLLLVYDLARGDGAACWKPGATSAPVLLDCGGRFSFRQPVLASLRSLGLTPDSVVLSHPDGGHVGGGHAVWQELPIRQVLMPVKRARSPAYRKWQQEAPRAGVELLHAGKVSELPVGGGARIEWLHLPDAEAQDVAADHRVLVMRLHWGRWKILLLGDAGLETEQHLLAADLDLAADVLIAGRPREGLSLGDDFVEAVRPRVMVLGTDDSPGVMPIGEGRLDHWRRSGIRIFDQSRCGAVLLRPQGDQLLIEGFLTGSRVHLD